MTREPAPCLSKTETYYARNRDRILLRKREYHVQNRERIRTYLRKYYRENRVRLIPKQVAYDKARRKSDPIFNAVMNLRRVMRAVLHGKRKLATSLELVGCGSAFLKGWLEARFQPGMTWDNYGEWHIDHKRPCASFDLSDAAQQRACFHYTNLQPLWAEENRRKGAKLIYAAA